MNTAVYTMPFMDDHQLAMHIDSQMGLGFRLMAMTAMPTGEIKLAWLTPIGVMRFGGRP